LNNDIDFDEEIDLDKIETEIDVSFESISDQSVFQMLREYFLHHKIIQS